MLNPTADMEVTANNVLCQVPLQCIEKCKYKKYPVLPRKGYEIEDENKYLEQTDAYWSRFLRSQAESSAKYLYRMSFFGSNRDPTMVKKEPFPPALIHQRLLHMPVIGSLDRDAMFYMLCFILNMLRLDPEAQKNILKKFRENNMIDNEILIYMQLISRHPNAGLTNDQRDHIINITQDIINQHSTIRSSNYFNPDHIFKKSFVEIDPYELEYLKSIMNTTEDLTKQEYLYLTMLVERLQEMPLAQRNQYLKLLHSKGVLRSEKFTTLSCYLNDKGKRFDSTRLKTLFQKLEALMDIAETLPPARPAEIPKKYISSIKIKTDAYKVTKTLDTLMGGGVENIVRLSELKNFLKNLLSLTPYELESTLNSLKNSYVLHKAQFQFLIDFITAGRLHGDPKKLGLLINMLEKVSGTPIGTQVPKNDNAVVAHQQGGAKKEVTVIKAAAPTIAVVASQERFLAMSSRSFIQKTAAEKTQKRLHEGIGPTRRVKDAPALSKNLENVLAETESLLLEKPVASKKLGKTLGETEQILTEKDVAAANKNEGQILADRTSTEKVGTDADKKVGKVLVDADPTSTEKGAVAANKELGKTLTETDPTSMDKDEPAASKKLERNEGMNPNSTLKGAATTVKGLSKTELGKEGVEAKRHGKEGNTHFEEDLTDTAEVSGDKEDNDEIIKEIVKLGGDGDVKRIDGIKANAAIKQHSSKKIGAGYQKKKGNKRGSTGDDSKTKILKKVKSLISAASILSTIKLEAAKTPLPKKEKKNYFEYPPPLYSTSHEEYLLEGPNGLLIPLIRKRALFFHFGTRSGKTNRIVSIKNGILRFR